MAPEVSFTSALIDWTGTADSSTVIWLSTYNAATEEPQPLPTLPPYRKRRTDYRQRFLGPKQRDAFRAMGWEQPHGLGRMRAMQRRLLPR